MESHYQEYRTLEEALEGAKQELSDVMWIVYEKRIAGTSQSLHNRLREIKK